MVVVAHHGLRHAHLRQGRPAVHENQEVGKTAVMKVMKENCGTGFRECDSLVFRQPLILYSLGRQLFLKLCKVFSESYTGQPLLAWAAH